MEICGMLAIMAVIASILILSAPTGLPVISISTKGEKPIDSKETWIEAEVSIDGGKEYESLPVLEAKIRGRGNSSWNWPKKPYTLKFKCGTEVLGMPRQKHWTLLANYMDRTLMRNAIAFDCGQATSLDWTPHYRFCELVLNGRHMGNYLLVEQIRADKNRVDVEKGGFLLETDFHFDNKFQWYSTHFTPLAPSFMAPSPLSQLIMRTSGLGTPFSIRYPEQDKLTPAKANEIISCISIAEQALYGENYLDPETGYRQYYDLQSFADYWLIYELMINREPKNPGSLYIHQKSDGKLYAGPIWDFDWGTLSYTATPEAEGNLFLTESVWYSRMTADPEFRRLAKKRWKELRPKFVAIEKNFDKYEKYLAASAGENFEIWNPDGDAFKNSVFLINGDGNLSFSEAVDKAKTIYIDRIQTIDMCLNTW